MSQSKTSPLAIFSCGMSIFAALVLLFSGYGYQWSWWELKMALFGMIPASAFFGLIALGLAIAFWFSKRKNPDKSGDKAAWVGLLLGLAVIGTVGYWFFSARQYPRIHDISTDIEQPPAFKNIVPLRADAANDTTYGDSMKAQTQRKYYPNVQTLYLDMEYSRAFDRALAAARQMPWEQIVTSDKQSGLIEAVDKLPWYGFKDDIVIRVDTADTEGHAKIDMRSVSRIGQSDIGVNAERIRDYLKTVQNL